MAIREVDVSASAINHDHLMAAGEFFASGFFENPQFPVIRRMARGIRRHLENTALPPYKDTFLYPSGTASVWGYDKAVYFHYSSGLTFNPKRMNDLIDKAREWQPGVASTLERVSRYLEDYHMVGSEVHPRFRLGGAGYTHSIPNVGRVLGEGINSYADRIRDRCARETKRDRVDFYQAMQDVLIGIRTFHQRSLQMLAGCPGEHITDLVAALQRVPFASARTFYEAIVAANFIFYIDGCDSLGRFDQDLGPFFERDLERGGLTRSYGVRLVRELWENVDANSGWNVTIGGSKKPGDGVYVPAYNELTRVCLEAAKNIRRPNLALRVTEDIPDDVFDLALDVIRTGCGLPALYNDQAYIDGLLEAHLNINERDLPDFAFGGCTETMMHGMSNVGSLDAGINLVDVLMEVLLSALLKSRSYDEVYDAFKTKLAGCIKLLVESVNREQRKKAQYQPQPVRSLLIDDCIDAGVEYNRGGARYNWSVINVAGLANVIDSLYVIKKLVFEERKIGPEQLLRALEDNFTHYETIKGMIDRCAKFGNDNEEIDSIATGLSEFIFNEFRKYAPWRGGRFLPGCLMFVTYADAGARIMASPDGRLAGKPIADSAGPVQGRDRSGPTAMIKSVCRIKHRLAPGTLVVNARFSPQFFNEPSQKQALKDLIRTYFRLGGMQIQINVVDQEVLLDAIEHPELHADLIVRVGGYSEYFNRLTPELKRSILERTQH